MEDKYKELINAWEEFEKSILDFREENLEKLTKPMQNSIRISLQEMRIAKQTFIFTSNGISCQIYQQRMSLRAYNP